MEDSLRFLIQLAHDNLHVERDDFVENAHGYQAFQPLVAMDQVAASMAAVMNIGFVPMRLADITLSAEEYIRVVDSILPAVLPVTQVAHFERYVQNIRSRKPNDIVNREDADKLEGDVNATFQRIQDVVNSGVNNGNRAYGLVVGRVQSGKTRNYIGLALRAYDAGYNAVIVLTSSNTALAAQTADRMTADFAAAGCTSTYLDFLNRVPPNPWVNGSRYFGVVLKEQANLGRVQEWLDRRVGQHVAEMRILVIDDEADNATPDIQQNAITPLTESDLETIAVTVTNSNAGVNDSQLDSIAKWIRSLKDLDCEGEAARLNINMEDVKIALRGATRRNALLAMLGDFNHPVCRVLKLDGEERIVNGDGVQHRRLAEIVASFFDNDARRNHPIDNWKKLRDLCWFALEIRPTRSRISGMITHLFSREDKRSQYAYQYGCMAYVGYTATPFANILNETPERDPLASDFIYPMWTSRRYFGLERIYGAPQGRDDAMPRMNVVRDITAEQSIVDDVRDIADASEEGRVDENLGVVVVRNGIASEPKEWSTLKDALAWLFCAAAFRRMMRLNTAQPERSNYWTTMLFNISSEKVVHDFQQNFLAAFLNHLSNQDAREAFLDRCHRLWDGAENNECVKFSRDAFNRVCPDYGTEIQDYPSWQELSLHLNWFLDRVANDNRVHAIAVNSTEEGRDNLARYRGNMPAIGEDHIWILCGGNTIARGLTLDGLVVSYFDRAGASTCVDTLEQMGRWFGYREGYELLPRIWMNAATIAEFKRMSKIEGLLHVSLKDTFNEYPDFTPKDKGHYAKIIRFGRELSGRSAAERNRPAGGGAEDTFGTMSLKNRPQAMNALHSFVDKMKLRQGLQLNRPVELYNNQGRVNESNFHAYPYWRDVAPELIKEFINEIASLSPNNDSRRMLQALAREIVTREWDVVVANPMTQAATYPIDSAQQIRVRMAQPQQIQRPSDDVISFPKVVGDNYAFYSGVETRAIVLAEVKMLKELLADSIWRPRGVNRGDCQQAVEAVEQRLHDGRPLEMLPSAVRRAAGFSRMSTGGYRDTVFDTVQRFLPNPLVDRPNPILQVSLLQPPAQLGVADGVPFVCISYYWPAHDATRYIWASVGFEDEPDTGVSTELVAETISSVIREKYFLSKYVLKSLVERLIGSPDISDDDFTQALKDGRADCLQLQNRDNRKLLSDTWYSKRWWMELSALDGRMSVCVRLREQLEMEARDLIEEVGAIPSGRLNGALSAKYPYRAGIVFPDRRGWDNFEELFENMEYKQELSRIILCDAGWVICNNTDEGDGLERDEFDH